MFIIEKIVMNLSGRVLPPKIPYDASNFSRKVS